VVSLALVSIADTSTPAAAIESMAPGAPIVGQEFTASAEHSIGASVASYEIVEPEPEPAPAAASFAAPVAGTPRSRARRRSPTAHREAETAKAHRG